MLGYKVSLGKVHMFFPCLKKHIPAKPTLFLSQRRISNRMSGHSIGQKKVHRRSHDCPLGL